MITAVAFVLFALIHSITVSRFFKNLAASALGETWVRAYYRLCFTIMAAATVAAAVYVIALQPDTLIFRPPWYVSIPCRVVQLGGVALMLWAVSPLDLGYFTGVRQAREYMRTGKTGGDIEGVPEGGLITTGPYALVRHPMYLGGMMIFLFEPNITMNTTALRVLAVIYFLWGGYIEERRFLADFGDNYRQYRVRVPKYNILKGIIIAGDK